MASFSEINYQTQLSTASDISSRLDSQYIRLGNNATVLALNTDKSIAIGNSAAAFGSSIAVGNETSAGNRSTSYKYSTAIGFRAKCDGMHSMQLGNSSGKLSSDYTLRFKDCVIATGTSSDDIKIPVTSLSGLDEKFITLSNSLSVKL